MAQIAAASGIAVGQIYRDFANKEAIIAAICEADLAAWLDEETLDAAVASGDSRAIRAWIERIGAQEPDDADRRLMCELLAEIGRNPAVAQLNRTADARVRCRLEAALAALAPRAAAARRATLVDFFIAMLWGISANMELSAASDHAALRAYALDLLRREIAALAAEPGG